jgi:hypothetical protein
MAVLDLKGKLTGVAKDLLSKTDKLTLTFTVDPEETEYLSYFRTDEELRIGVQKWFPKRSVSANNLYWSCIQEIAAKLRSSEEQVHLDMMRNYGVSTKVLVEPQYVAGLHEVWKLVEEGETVTIGGKDYVSCSCYYGTSKFRSDEFARLMDGVLEEMKQMELIPPSKADVVNSLAVWKAMSSGDSSCDEAKGNVYDEARGEEKPAAKKEKKKAAAAAPAEPVSEPAAVPEAEPVTAAAPAKPDAPVEAEVTAPAEDAFRGLADDELPMTEVDALFTSAAKEAPKEPAAAAPVVDTGRKTIRFQRRA